MEESDGVSSTQTVAGSDTVEDTQNTTVLVQMEEEERAIRAMPFVTTLSFVRAVKGKAEGWRVTLTCYACREYNSCGKKLPRPRERSVGWPRGHGENEGHSRHHARQGTHDDRKNNVAHSSGSALASHVLQKGVAHGARKYTD